MCTAATLIEDTIITDSNLKKLHVDFELIHPESFINKDTNTTVEITSKEYEKNYTVIREAMFDVSSLTDQIDYTNSLYEIGRVLSKDGRDITKEEALALNSYYRKKYRKVTKRK